MRITEDEIRRIIHEEIIREARGAEARERARRDKLFQILPAATLERMDLLAARMESLEHLKIYKQFMRSFGGDAVTRLEHDADLLGRFAGGILKDYVRSGEQPEPADAGMISNLFNRADATPDETGISWFDGTCYRGEVIQATTLARGLDVAAQAASKRKPGWMSDPIGKVRGEIAVTPSIRNYYDFVDWENRDFFVSFSASRSSAKIFTGSGRAGFGYWAMKSIDLNGPIAVVNPLFECRVTSPGAVIDPRRRAESIDRSMNEGLHEVVGCPYISRDIEIQRIFIPYEELERGVDSVGGDLISYLNKLDESRLHLDAEGDYIVIDFRNRL